MDAPKCRLCEKRHYGTCAESRTAAPSEKRARPAKRPAQKHTRTQIDAGTKELLERVVALEQIVDELLAGKRKRSEYMKGYMRDRRARDGG